MRCEFGYCMICDKEVARKCGECGSRTPGSQYTEVDVKWSNGAIMKIGVCVDCATANAHGTDEAKKSITQAHWDHWGKIGGQYGKEIVIV